MNSETALKFSVELCKVAYESVLRVPKLDRKKIRSQGKNDVLWQPDMVAFNSVKRFLENSQISFNLIAETSEIKSRVPTAITVLLDELEGTRNFKDRNGPFAVSVGILRTIKTNPHIDILGAAVLVRDSWGERIYSADNRNAYLTVKGKTQQIDCTNKKLENCSIAVGDYHTSNRYAKLLPLLALYGTKKNKPLNPLTETISGSYASAIDLCYCADPSIGVVGYMDLRGLWANGKRFSNHGVKFFDVTPSIHILECAGGKVTDAFGNELKYTFEKPEHVLTAIAASNTEIHQELVERLREVMKFTRYSRKS